MADDQTLTIFPIIQSLVCDKLQVVSYKWLSRNFAVSSNHAKRILQEFAEKFHNELEMIYILSGWSVKDPKTYSVKLASSLKLSEVKKEFENGCSVQVYSVQACIPKDIAVIWNTEFVQAEELFNQPLTKENCLRDNRFCGVSNSFVKHSAGSKHAHDTQIQRVDRGSAVSVASKTSSTSIGQTVRPPQHASEKRPIPRPEAHLSRELASEHFDKTAETVGKTGKLPVAKGTITASESLKNKVKSEKASSGSTGSLTNLWGRASEQPKAQTSYIPVLGGVDDVVAEEDDHDISIKRDPNGSSGRQRRVVVDFSDDDDYHGGDGENEDVVSLASPDTYSAKGVTDPFTNSVVPGRKMSIDEGKEQRLRTWKDNNELGKSAPSSEAGIKSRNTKMTAGITLKERTPYHTLEDASIGNEDQTSNDTSTLSKRRKVLKTRIDGQGREVTETVWEDETVADDKLQRNKPENNDISRPVLANRAHGAGSHVSATASSRSKGGSKKPAKGGPKVAKQGTLLSFFKSVNS